MSEQLKASSMLLLAPLLWGVTFPLMHVVLQYCSANLFVFWRFLIAAILLSYVLILAIKRKQLSRIDLIYGILIGLTNCGAFVLQAVSLEFEPDSSKVAFLTGINVVLVPLLMPLLKMRKPTFNELLAAVICLFGIFVINKIALTFNTSDIFVFMSTFCIALGIILVEKASLVCKNLLLLTFYQIIFTIFIPFLYLKGQVAPIFSHNIVWWALIYCAIFATVIPIIVQLKFQHIVGSSKAAIIYSLEAFAAMFFAILFFGESVSMNVIIGGCIIMFSAIYNDLFNLVKIRLNK